MLRDYIQRLSSYTIYVFASSKLLVWSLGMILLHAEFEMSDMFSLASHPVTKYVMLLISVLAFAAIKLKKYPMCLVSSICFVFIWVYTTLGFGMTHHWFHSSNFLRNAVETLFIIYLALTIGKNRKIDNGY